MHGHTYQVDLIIEGEHKGGMLIDFADIKRALREVLATYDHKSWNDFLEYPTVENICELLHRRLKGHFKMPFTLRVWEGHGKYAEL